MSHDPGQKDDKSPKGKDERTLVELYAAAAEINVKKETHLKTYNDLFKNQLQLAPRKE